MSRSESRGQGNVEDRELERQGTRLGRSATWFLVLGTVFAAPGIVLVVIHDGWSVGFGIAVLLIASIPAAIGVGLIVSSAIARWSARHKSFA